MMGTLTSKCETLNRVNFPAFMGERHYMVKFFKDQGPPDLPMKEIVDAAIGELIRLNALAEKRVP